MSEQLLNKIFEKLVTMEKDIQTMKGILPALATKEDVGRLAAEGQKDVVAMLQFLEKKIIHTATKDDMIQIADTQALHSEILRNLTADAAQHKAEISLLKRAK